MRDGLPPRSAHRRRRGPAASILGLLVAVTMAVVAVALVGPWAGASPGSSGGAAGGPATGTDAVGPGATGSPGAQQPDATRTRSAATPDARPKATVVQRGEGTFRPARGGSKRSGTGDLLRYRVEAEQGINQDPQEFAQLVDQVFADERGWAAANRWAFQRVASGPVDFVVRLASPDTVDEICGRYGLQTNGEVSCRGGQDVIINLRRWLLAIPSFKGDVGTYRHAVVNHEVGHFLGFDHVQCPGQDEPMPVMGTPFYGLEGCRPNGWPRPEELRRKAR